MSLHFEVVFTCLLRADTPDSVLAALRWHLGLDAERPADLDEEEHAYPLLAPDPASFLPGEDFASLRRKSRDHAAGGGPYVWELSSRNHWLDDDLGELVTVLDLLAPYAEDSDCGGYFREEHDVERTVFTFRDGAYDHEQRTEA
ncbi:hypothetical protein ACIBF1_34225 [Spirillospora sp. NPDC050679]